MSDVAPNTGPLPRGCRVGCYAVVDCTGDRMELRGHRGAAAGMVVGGIALTAFGLLDWWAFLTDNGQASKKALVLPLVGAVLVWAGVVQWGSRLTFDRNGLAKRRGAGHAARPDAAATTVQRRACRSASRSS
jgi:hypothetical protein